MPSQPAHTNPMEDMLEGSYFDEDLSVDILLYYYEGLLPDVMGPIGDIKMEEWCIIISVCFV